MHRTHRPALAGLLALALLAAAGAGTASEERARELIEQCRTATAALKSLQADVEIHSGASVYRGTVTLRRPNLARLELSDYAVALTVSNGRELITYRPKTNQYTKAEVRPDGDNIRLIGTEQVRGFFVPQTLMQVQPGDRVAYIGREQVAGSEYDVIEIGAATGRRVARYYLSPADRLVHRVTVTTRSGDRELVLSGALSNLKTNVEAPETLFAYTPPEDAKLLDVRAALARVLAQRQPLQPQNPVDRLAQYEARLIPVGKKVPDFDLPQAGGSRLSLYKQLKQGKVTLINFWFHGCPPCRRELPELQKMYEELKGKGFQIVAVNRGDSAEVVGKYWGESGFTFPHVLGGSGEQYRAIGEPYGVQAYPTNYLVDSEGNVLWRKVAFNEAALRKALQDAGIK